MELLDWLTGSDSTETYSSAKPPDFLGVQSPKPPSKLQSQANHSPVRTTSVESSRGHSEISSLTPLESRMKDLILNIYSHKWISEENFATSETTEQSSIPILDEQHKRLHILPSTESQEAWKFNLHSVNQEDWSVELATSDEEESQTLGTGILTSAFPSSLLRVSPIGSESKSKLDPSISTHQVPVHIRRPELPSQGTGGSGGVPKLPVELELDLSSVEQELISRSAPEGISDSDTDLPQIVGNSSSNLLTKQQLPSSQQKAGTPFKDQSPSKMSDAHSIASSGSFVDDQLTSVPFFSADDRNINFNPSDSEVPQVVPSLHQDDVPYASFYASARDSGTRNIPSALRPSSSAAPYGPSVGVDDPNFDFSILYSFTDSSYKSRMTKDSSKPPRSKVVDSFGVSMDTYQSTHSKTNKSEPAHVHVHMPTKKAASVGDEYKKVLHFHKPRFVSESDEYPVDSTKEASINNNTSTGGSVEREEEGEEREGEREGERGEKEEEERNSSTPVFDTNSDEDNISKEATPVPELASTLTQEPAPVVANEETNYSHPGLTSGQIHTESLQSESDKTEESPQVQPQLTSPDNVDSSGPLEFDHTDEGDVPVHYSESQPTGKEAGEPQRFIQHGEKKEESAQPLSLDAPSYRVSRLDSDIETNSVVSVQELTEMLHSMPPQSHADQPALTNTTGKIPFSLPLVHSHTTQEGSAQTTPTRVSLASHHTPQQTPTVVKPWTPISSKHTPPPLPCLQVASKLPQHLQLSPKLPPKGASPLPTVHTRESSSHSEVSEGSSLLIRPDEDPTKLLGETKRSMSLEERRLSDELVKRASAIKEQRSDEMMDEGAQKQLQSLEEELAKALQEKANLEGQLDSVTEECKVMMKDRADLQSKLARSETELAEISEALERERRKPSSSEARPTKAVPVHAHIHVPPPTEDLTKLKDDLVKIQSDLEREKETVAGLKSEIAKEKQNSRKLQSNLEWTKQSLEEQQSSVTELQEKVKDLQSMVDQKSSDLEEAGAKLSSLEASYGALQGTKDWLHGQLENVLEEKKKLQEEWRESKANAMAQSMKAEQLLKENTAFQQRVADLQQGILQDKAKLVNELEAIEADVLSREDSYGHLVTEKAQLEDMVKMKGDVLEKLNSDLARAQVEKEELEAKMEDSEMQYDVLTHKIEDLERQNEALAKKLKLAGQELDTKSSDAREIEKARVALQERVKQLDAALISKDGTCQGLTDANEILKYELEAVKQDRDKLEEEFDKTKEVVAMLEADLKLANDSNRGKDTEFKSLTQMREASSAESQALKERLAEKERELEEKTNELEALEAQSGELLGQFKMLQDQFQSIAADTGSVQDSVTEKDRVIAHLASEKDKAEEELAGLKEEAEQLKNKVTQLEHKNAHLEGEVEASSSSHFEEFQKAVQDKAQLQAELNSLKLGQQHESIRAQAKANRLESDLKAVKKEMERGQREHQKALRGREEEIRMLEEEKLKLEAAVNDWKNRLEHAQREKERLQSSVETQKPVSSTLGTLTARCEQFAQQNQALSEKLQQESSQRAEIERASGMVAAKLKQNARDEEKKLQRQIRDLSLEVERLRGRLSGMNTTQLAMRDHAASLEAALAKRESSLVKLSAQAQKVLEEKETEDQAFAAQIGSLEKQIEDSAKEGEAWKAKANSEKKKAGSLGQQLSQKEMELMDLKSLLEQSKQSGRSVPYLEEKIAELAIEKDDLLSQTSSLKTQLTVARTAVDIARKDLADRSSQVDILKRELDMAKSQRVQAESEARQLQEQLKGAENRYSDEVGRLKEALRRERESSVMEERDTDTKSGLFDSSLSMIVTEDVDKARSGIDIQCTCMYICKCTLSMYVYIYVVIVCYFSIGKM